MVMSYVRVAPLFDLYGPRNSYKPPWWITRAIWFFMRFFIFKVMDVCFSCVCGMRSLCAVLCFRRRPCQPPCQRTLAQRWWVCWPLVCFASFCFCVLKYRFPPHLADVPTCFHASYKIQDAFFLFVCRFIVFCVLTTLLLHLMFVFLRRQMQREKRR